MTQWAAPRAVLGALLVTGLLLTGCTPAAAPTPTPPPAPAASATGVAASGDFAGLVTVGSRKLWLECRGSGGPTVVLQSGFGNAADIWSYTEKNPPPVYQGTAGFARVCAYDRPGSTRLLDDAGQPAPSPLPSRSDPAPMPRTGADVVTELHDLLGAAGVPGPYVFVGHSLGGLFNLQYARTYPDQVAGLVMIDATSPALQTLLTPKQFDVILKQPLSNPPEVIADYVGEAYDLDRTLEQLAAAAPLPSAPGAKPAAVLAAAGLQPGAPPELEKVMGAVQPKAQAALAASIPGSKLTTVPGTTHYIQLEKPDVVIEAIRSVRSG